MTEHGGEYHGREGLPVGVVGHYRIVEGLAGEGDLVFRGGQFLAELHHVLVGFQVGIGFHHHIETAHGAGKGLFAASQGAHGLGIAGVGCSLAQGVGGGVARIDHGFQGFPLMLHVGLGGFHQVGDQVIATLELNLDLGKGVLVAVFQGDEGVVYADDIHDQAGDDDQYDNSDDSAGSHNSPPL